MIISELFDKETNAQKEGSHKLPQAHEKVYNENERNKKKRYAHKNVIDGRKPFIWRTQRTGENDLNKNSGNNEGTICLVNE